MCRRIFRREQNRFKDFRGATLHDEDNNTSDCQHGCFLRKRNVCHKVYLQAWDGSRTEVEHSDNVLPNLGRGPHQRKDSHQTSAVRDLVASWENRKHVIDDEWPCGLFAFDEMCWRRIQAHDVYVFNDVFYFLSLLSERRFLVLEKIFMTLLQELAALKTKTEEKQTRSTWGQNKKEWISTLEMGDRALQERMHWIKATKHIAHSANHCLATFSLRKCQQPGFPHSFKNICQIFSIFFNIFSTPNNENLITSLIFTFPKFYWCYTMQTAFAKLSSVVKNKIWINGWI